MDIDTPQRPEMKIQRLFIYPVKSLLPIEVKLAEITSEGFRFDRQFIIVKAPEEGSSTRLLRHLTIKTTPKLGLFQPSISDDWSEITITHTLSGSHGDASISVPLTPPPVTTSKSSMWEVNIFGTSALGLDMGDGPAEFFTKHLDIPSRLLFIAGSGRREIPGLAYHPKQMSPLNIRTGALKLQPQRLRFADAAPLLITTTASEDDARARLPPSRRAEDVLIRFRPNIHIDVGENGVAYGEDEWTELVATESQGTTRRHIALHCVFRTPRCLSLNVDLITGDYSSRDNQLYGLLAKDRRVNKAFPHKPVFGQYAFATPFGATLRVGDTVLVKDV